MRPVLGLTLLLVGGCTWISSSQLDARLPEMDDDGDGYPKATDCDDADPAISPRAEETWYDGVDSDCAGDDDYDADKDGFVPDEWVGFATEGVEGSGELPGGDCNDGDPDAWPGAPDSWYDGIDTDCAGDDDYDADGDGYVPVNAGGLPTENVEGSGALPEGDCDDADPGVHPDAEDAWYDGIDTDCAGDDDYDADGDGYYPDGVDYGETTYAPGTGGLLGGDCDDAAADVHPDAEDAWYDGVDSDCAGDDDYDADKDGYVPDAYVGEATLYVEGSGALPGGDCDDADAAVLPGAVETLDDGVDQDCDGGDSTFSMSGPEGFLSAYDTFTWSGAHDLRVHPHGSTVTFGLAAGELSYGLEGDLATVYDGAFAFAFTPSATAEAGADLDFVQWYGSSVDLSNSLTPGHDLVVTDDAIFGAIGVQTTSSKRYLVIGGLDLASGHTFTASTYILASGGASYEDFSDLSISVDDAGDVVVVACDGPAGDVAQLMWGSSAALIANDTSGIQGEKLSGFSVDQCAVVPGSSGPVEVLTTTGTGVDRYTLDLDATEITPTLDASWTDLEPADIAPVRDSALGPWTVIPDAAARSIVLVDRSDSETVLAVGTDPIAAQGTWDAANDRLVIGYIDGSGDAHLLLGTPTAGWDSYDVNAPFSGAEEIAVAVDPDGSTLFLGLLGGDRLAFGLARLP